MTIQISQVLPTDRLFPGVVQLGKRNSRYLGLYPEGAFVDSARKGWILAAVDLNGALRGYLLYRISRSHVTIAHLCVEKSARGQGVARALFEGLVARTEEYVGVKLRCRRDFPANEMWRKLGFVPIAERPGRSASGKPLTSWFYSYGQPGLFDGVSDDRARAVLDANVLFDLQDHPEDPERGAAVLSAAWLSTEVEFCLTGEIFVEIDQVKEAAERARRRGFAHRFALIEVDRDAEQQVWSELRPFFPAKLSRNDESDLRHLAITAAGGGQFFVTRDGDLLRRAEEVEARYGVSIVHPLELVVDLDSKVRRAEYIPTRVAGTLTSISRVGPAELSGLAPFQASRAGETKRAFTARLLTCGRNPRVTETCVIKNNAEEERALFCLDFNDRDRLRVPLLRLSKGPLVNEYAHYIAWRAVLLARSRGHRLVEMTDQYVSDTVATALRACDYIETEGRWHRHVLPVCGPRSELVWALQRQQELASDAVLETALARLPLPSSAAWAGSVARLEKVFWPARITDAGLETYIVPVRPAFAAQLFDESLAGQEIFGADLQLALSLRNVYYRSARGIQVPAPARVLWYVSREKGYQGVGAIRAVSLVEESVRGSAKELFRRYRRLGAYTWKQVLRAAKGDPEGRLEAFTFTHTELFTRPVVLTEAQDILVQSGMGRSTFPGPLRIHGSSFERIYELGTQ